MHVPAPAFDIDIEQCACGGKLKLIAVIAEPAMIDLMGGHISVAVTSATAALAQVISGKLRIVGVTSRQRIPSAHSLRGPHRKTLLCALQKM